MKIAVFEDDFEVVEWLYNLYHQSEDDGPNQDYAIQQLATYGMEV